MKKFLVTLTATAFAASLSLAQVGTPADAGLTPRTPTIDVNTNFNNNNLETGSVIITANTNVVLGWEDDGACSGDIDYWGVAWAMYNSVGGFLTTPTLVTNYTGSNSITSPYGSAFRDDGTMGPSHVMWGAKVKANQFGNGFGAGGNGDAGIESVEDEVCFTYGIGFEIPRLFDTMNDEGGAGLGNFPAVQLLNNDGSKAADVLSGATVADADPAGSIRLGDWEYLSNGNIVIAGESRQVADRALTGQTGGNVATYTIVTPAGAVVKAYAAATSEVGPTAAGQDMWHGVAVTANGFALRFNQGGTKIRLFDNNGNPTTPNIDLATATCHPEAGAGGRGDGIGFAGNGDAYVYACSGNPAGPWVTVINADGSIRYSRKVGDAADSLTGGGTDRLGAGISEDGRVIVAFQAANNDTNNVNVFGLPQARLFDPCGRAIGPVFYVSERETPANALASNGGDGRPRVAFRGNTIAAMWGSLNSPTTSSIILAFRIFDAPPLAACAPGPTVSVEQSGGNAIISWNASFGNLTLQSTPTLLPSAWACVSPQPAIVPVGSLNTMTVPIGPGNAFFRLQE